MASPSEAAAPNGISTPPPTTSTTAPARGGAAGSPSTLNTPSNQASQPQNAPSAQSASNLPTQNRTSATDAGSSKRPRDQRILHLLLASMGVQAYEERVPLMLQDFAYRYQVGVLSDALSLMPDNHMTAAHNPNDKKAAPEPVVSLMAVRQAINSRIGYQFNATLPKEFQLEIAQERNRSALPKVEREFGVRLPGEKYVLTGTGWGLQEEWESEEEVVGGVDVEMGEGEEEKQNEFEEVMGVDAGPREGDAMEM